MDASYFSNLIPELATRSARATISMLGFSNKALRAHLRDAFASAYGEQGSFLGDPVFEATFGWATADKALGELSGSLLCPSLVTALNEPPGGKDRPLARVSWIWPVVTPGGAASTVPSSV